MRKLVLALAPALGLLAIVIFLTTAGTQAAVPGTANPAFPDLGGLFFGAGAAVGGSGEPVRALAAGDLDLDGDLDLLSAAGKLYGWENQGAPFAGPWSSATVGAPDSLINALALGDLDNDGDLDVASGRDLMAIGYEMQLWQNDGSPFDTLWAAGDVGNSHGVLALALGDLDLDGDLDLVSGDDAAWVVSWENDGTPFDNTWATSDIFITSDGIESLALVDVDGDGDLDALAGCGAGEEYALTSWQKDGDPFAGPWTRT